MTDSNKTMTTDEVLEVISRCEPDDFDGHVDWNSLSFEKQLEWIVVSARLYLEWGETRPYHS